MRKPPSRPNHSKAKLPGAAAANIPVAPTLAIPVAAARAPVISLAGRAYLEIRNRILKGELPVGVVLSRRKLAEALNISVPPVFSRRGPRPKKKRT